MAFSEVFRTFGVEFVILDIIFCFIWMALLIRKKYFLQLLIGFFGTIVVFFTDFVIWYTIKDVREIFSLPDFFSPLTFLIYFSFTYGMIEFSYVAVMFSAKDWRKMLFWTILLYSGWFTVALLPNLLPMADNTIYIVRRMASGRWIQIVMAAVGYLLLIILKYLWEPFKSLTWKRIGYLILVGFAIHFAMEITLFVAGIRTGSDVLSVLVFNSLVEFNMGVPILFFLWTLLKNKIPTGGETEELPIEGTSLPVQNIVQYESLKEE